VELTSTTGHSALLYVAAVQRHGHLMTVEDFEAYVDRPDRRAPAPTLRYTRQRRRIPIDDNLIGEARRAAEAIWDKLSWAVGEMEPSPAEPGETVTQWLVRLRWLAVEDDRVRITPLGQAVLAHLEASGVDADLPLSVVLDPKDELALARVVGELNAAGRCALVDPYFSIDHLLTVLHNTEIDRVLTGIRDGKKLASLEVALNSFADPPRPFEIRKSDDFHDRIALPESGPLLLIGTSLTGIGARLSMMVKLDESSAAGKAVRGRFEELWRDAEPVGKLEPEAQGEPADADEEKAPEQGSPDVPAAGAGEAPA
jgi:hypothetical protein